MTFGFLRDLVAIGHNFEAVTFGFLHDPVRIGKRNGAKLLTLGLGLGQ